MASIAARAEAGFEPIPGYVLREKLGAGGYGEVWKADAPGGLKKAIKIVFGSLDESRAAAELKALHRIRQVAHPFLLSLERIEIVEGQLMIVCELADGSLVDRFQHQRERGNVGIPRNQLLEYLRDAADALDFLCQKHDLQHLDVKPANMLLIADRVKVADFGLVKDLQSNSMSMVGGMTPTYAAPEMFDGKPGRFSDQYSLAIVYQELLTGTYPFSGRTTAQLASEHLHRAPNFESVPPGDRPILARALAKKPKQRYGSCRELIDHLLNADRVVHNNATPNSDPHARRVSPSHDHNARQISPAGNSNDENPSLTSPRVSSTSFPRSTQTYEPRELVNLPAIDVEAENESTIAPSLFIGLGGTGAEILTSLRAEMTRDEFAIPSQETCGWLLVDTDAKTLDQAIDDQTCGHLPLGTTLHLPLKPAAAYREKDDAPFSPISRRWLFNIPRSRTTEGVRPLAMVAFLDQADACYRTLQAYVQHLGKNCREGESDSNPALRVYIAGSLHGGTGSALLSEIAYLLRQASSELNIRIAIQFVLTAGEQNERNGRELMGASAISSLSEVSHYFQTGGLHPGLPSLPANRGTAKPPADQVYLVYGGVVGDQVAWHSAIEQAALYLHADSRTAMGAALQSARLESVQNSTDSEDIDWVPWLRTVGTYRMDFNSNVDPEYVAQVASLQSLQKWLTRLRMNVEFDSNNTIISNRDESKRGSRKAKTIEQIDFVVSDLFREKKWTAQAWVARCIVMLLQTDHVPLDGSGLTDEQASELKLDDGIDVELHRLAEKLSVNVEECRYDAQNLLILTIEDLLRWVQDSWLPSKSAWGYLAEMLDMIAHRFAEQGASLCSVSQRIRSEHDEALSKLHNLEEPLSPEAIAQTTERLDRMEVDARLHEIAGKMLGRVGQHVSHLIVLWRAEAASILQEVDSLHREHASSLGYELLGKGQLSRVIPPMSNSWDAVRGEVEKCIETRLENYIGENFWSVIHRQFLANQSEIDTANPTDDEDTVDSDTDQIVPQLDAQQPEEAATPVAVEEAEEVEPKPALPKNVRSLLEDAHEVAEERATRAQLTWTTDENAKIVRVQKSYSPSQLQDATCPPLVQWGGALRLILLLPSEGMTEDQERVWRSMLRTEYTVIRSKHIAAPCILGEGEQLILPEVINRLWAPNQEKLALSHRLHTRIDVDWLPIQGI